MMQCYRTTSQGGSVNVIIHMVYRHFLVVARHQSPLIAVIPCIARDQGNRFQQYVSE